jgi:hypothetical protein
LASQADEAELGFFTSDVVGQLDDQGEDLIFHAVGAVGAPSLPASLEFVLGGGAAFGNGGERGRTTPLLLLLLLLEEGERWRWRDGG